MKGAEEVGHKTEKISLKDKKINYCNGSCDCLQKKTGCRQKDDMAGIINKMMVANVIVLATPLYFYSMCGQLKTFIDRTYSELQNILMQNKEYYFLVAGTDPNKYSVETAVKELRAFLYCFKGSKECGVIYAAGVSAPGDVKANPAFVEAYQMGKHIK